MRRSRSWPCTASSNVPRLTRSVGPPKSSTSPRSVAFLVCLSSRRNCSRLLFPALFGPKKPVILPRPTSASCHALKFSSLTRLSISPHSVWPAYKQACLWPERTAKSPNRPLGSPPDEADYRMRCWERLGLGRRALAPWRERHAVGSSKPDMFVRRTTRSCRSSPSGHSIRRLTLSIASLRASSDRRRDARWSQATNGVPFHVVCSTIPRLRRPTRRKNGGEP